MFETECYSRLLPLKKVINNDDLELIEDIVIRTNEIIRESYQFTKAYVLYCCDNNLELELIDLSFFKIVFSLVAIPNNQGKKTTKTDLKGKLKEFYDNYYVGLQVEKVKTVSNDLLHHEVIQMITSIENHIKMHFYSYLKRMTYVHISKNEDNYQTKRRKLLNDLYNDTYNSDEEYHPIIEAFGPLIMETRKTRLSKPQNSLYLLFKINREIQVRNGKTLSLMPLRTSTIPSSITLSRTICKTGFRDEEIWNYLYDKANKLFKPKKGFKLKSIKTDGVSCSLIFSSEKKIKVRRSCVAEQAREKYIDELSLEKLTKYASIDSIGRKLYNNVAADPNKGNLAMFQDNNGIKLRYTQCQRKRETHSGRYRKIRLKREKLYLGKYVTDDEEFNLNDNLQILSLFNSNTTYLEEFKQYIFQKNKFASRFNKYYKEYWYRKHKFNIKINSKRTKDKFLNKFEEIYGSPENTIISFGDWQQRPGISFGKEPTIGIGFRNWFKSRGYKVYLVDEYNSSKTCNKCLYKNDYNFMSRIDPRPWMKKQDIKTHKLKHITQKVWELTRCTNNHCRTIHNRDVNASKNILDISNSYINQISITKNFKRGFKWSDNTTDIEQHSIHTSAYKQAEDLAPISMGLTKVNGEGNQITQ
jgi:hypothetical protein